MIFFIIMQDFSLIYFLVINIILHLYYITLLLAFNDNMKYNSICIQGKERRRDG